MHFWNSFSFKSPLLIGALSLVGSVGANPPTAITLGEALQRAEVSNPTLAAGRLSVRATEALTDQADLRPNPTLDLELENFGGSGPLQGIDGVAATLLASQRIERGDKRSRRVALANARTEVARQGMAVRLTHLRHQTATAYIETLVAARRVALAQEIVAATQDAIEAINQRVADGRASPAESARARAAIVSARVALNRAESSRKKAHAALGLTWGDPAAEIAPADTLPTTLALPDQLALFSKMESHARMDLQRSEISRRQRALDLQHAAAKSDLTIGGGVRFLNEGSDAAFVAGISWPLPIRNQNQGNIRAAREDLAAAAQSVDGVRNELQLAFMTAWQDLTAAHTAAETLRHEARPAVEEVYAITRQAFEEGQVGLVEVVLAARERIALETDILAAEATYALALVELDALTDPTFPLTTALLTSP